MGGATHTVVLTMEEVSLLEAQPHFRVRLVTSFLAAERFGIKRFGVGVKVVIKNLV